MIALVSFCSLLAFCFLMIFLFGFLSEIGLGDSIYNFIDKIFSSIENIGRKFARKIKPKK